MGNSKQKNNVLRVEIDNAGLARRLGVTPHYVRYLLKGERFNVDKLLQIRSIVLNEQDRLTDSALTAIIGKIDQLIAEAKKKVGE